MDLHAFIERRQPDWNRLEHLVARVEKGGFGALSLAEGEAFHALYLAAAGDLNRAQTRTGNAVLLDPLEALVARAYGLSVPPRRVRLFASWWRILRHGFPAALRAHAGCLLLSAALLVAGVLFGAVATAVEPGLARVFLPAEHLVESPAERIATLEAIERGEIQVDHAGQVLFSAFLAQNNIRVSILAFALGLTFGIGTAVVLFFNGVLIGCIVWRYLADGAGLFLAGWIGPHGAIELPCIAFAGAAGFVVARAQWGGLFRRVAWRQVRADRDALVAILVGTATWLVPAAIIEGRFSQISEPTLPYALKAAAAAVILIGFMAYLFVLPVRTAPR